VRIVVIDGAGMIGRLVVREALDRGHHVTVVARDPSKVGERDQRLDLVQGDVLERDQIAAAVEGQDVVVSAVGSAREATPDASLYLRAAESLVRALRGLGEGAPPLVVVGGVGSLPRCGGPAAPGTRAGGAASGARRTEGGPRLLSDGLGRALDVCQPAGPDRAGRSGTYRVGVDELLVRVDDVSAISMEDYAVALVDEIETPRHLGRRFTVGY
jgi:uncharacterized protein